jgi:hypothetical protein
MQSTGVYWLPVYEILTEAGLRVFLVNARRTKNLPGRKTDVQECQWLLQLHTFGLLNNSFRPPEEICELRAYWRLRARLGAPKAITARAHMLARLVYRMLRYGEQYVDKGMKYFEEKYRQHEILSIQKKPKDLGFAVTLTPAAV